jgi:serine/threonine protein kinase
MKDRDTGEILAAKITPFNQIRREMWENEVRMLQQCQYIRGVVKMYEYGTYLDRHKTEHGFIITELCKGDLVEFPLHKSEFTKFLCFVVNMLCVFHHMNLCLCDLKRENILRKGTGYRLCDFSSCQPVGTLTGFLYGTPHLLAPELIESVPVGVGYYYDDKVDIWNLGCLLFEIATSEPAFENDGKERSRAVLYKNIMSKTPTYSLIRNRHIRHLIQSCLSKNPKNRATITQLQHMLKETGSFR